MIRVLLIHDLPMVRESLALALASASVEAHCCSSVEESIELLQTSPLPFEVILLRQRAWNTKADQLLAFTNRGCPQSKVVLMPSRLSDLNISSLLGLGAAGVVAEERSLADLIDTIHDVAAGRTALDSNRANPFYAKGRLSEREQTAAELVVEGLSNKEIAIRMGVSESYVKALLQRVFLKMEVNNRGQLVRILIEKSLEAQIAGLKDRAAGQQLHPWNRPAGEPDLLPRSNPFNPAAEHLIAR